MNARAPLSPSRSELQSAARALYRKTLLTSKDEFLSALNNLLACADCEDLDVLEALYRLAEVACDLEGPAPELSAITDWSAA